MSRYLSIVFLSVGVSVSFACKSGSVDMSADSSTPQKAVASEGVGSSNGEGGAKPAEAEEDDIRSKMPFVSKPRAWGDDVPDIGDTVELSEKEWGKKLTKKEFYILREEGTERAFSGALLDVKEKGVYHCAACNNPVFDSATKFESGTGWPSFFEPIQMARVKEIADNSLGMTRVEVECAVCGGHLGHVFEDGPEPTGLRYCINSWALDFHPDDPDVTVEEDED